ncbi:coA-transferase III family protein [Mycobacterium xenopi 4042]|uniref:CoA-transferase III family protein n=1 Tax=Mycobacterium xenopi 4042 TaxID=1299334 RepID=X7ZWG4_MYCXE|nr:coA-transferase III family protein [Mycobacterium xenopi 4042]
MGAAQAAVHGILAALIERDSSGRGQFVESNLVTGMGAMDPTTGFTRWCCSATRTPSNRWTHHSTTRAVPGIPDLPPFDGADERRALASVRPGLARLMQAWLTELDLVTELADPKWQGFPMLPSAELRTEWWDMMLQRVRARTLAEWEQAFAANHDLSGELFRSPQASLDHPQVRHEGRAVTVIDPELGAVRQPSTLIHADGKPLTRLRPAPRLGEHNAELTSDAPAAPPVTPSPGGGPRDLPLHGLTILEFGSMFAGPYGATLLTDLGARVIKVEPLDGDNIRTLVAFPEAGGAKVLQGKESVAIDFTKPEGLELVYELVKHVDAVLQCFRGQAAKRAKIDEATLKAVNPDLVFVSARVRHRWPLRASGRLRAVHRSGLGPGGDGQPRCRAATDRPRRRAPQGGGVVRRRYGPCRTGRRYRGAGRCLGVAGRAVCEAARAAIAEYGHHDAGHGAAGADRLQHQLRRSSAGRDGR